jgi:hypothetical protein
MTAAHTFASPPRQFPVHPLPSVFAHDSTTVRQLAMELPSLAPEIAKLGSMEWSWNSDHDSPSSSSSVIHVGLTGAQSSLDALVRPSMLSAQQDLLLPANEQPIMASRGSLLGRSAQITVSQPSFPTLERSTSADLFTIDPQCSAMMTAGGSHINAGPLRTQLSAPSPTGALFAAGTSLTTAISGPADVLQQQASGAPQALFTEHQAGRPAISIPTQHNTGYPTNIPALARQGSTGAPPIALEHQQVRDVESW